MQIYNAKDMGHAFRTVRKNTIQVAEDIPENQYDFRAAEGCRTVAESLRHIAVATIWPIYAHGKRLTEFKPEMFLEARTKQEQAEARLKTKSDILKALRDHGEEFAAFVEGLPDAVLAEKVSFPPEANMPPKTRFEMLLSSKEHEMHHRGQLMLVERLLGIKPHLTKQMDERVAAMTQQQAARGV
jgi:uncharacterized damage-inducible protein DinB